MSSLFLDNSLETPHSYPVEIPATGFWAGSRIKQDLKKWLVYWTLVCLQGLSQEHLKVGQEICARIMGCSSKVFITSSYQKDTTGVPIQSKRYCSYYAHNNQLLIVPPSIQTLISVKRVVIWSRSKAHRLTICSSIQFQKKSRKPVSRTRVQNMEERGHKGYCFPLRSTLCVHLPPPLSGPWITQALQYLSFHLAQ